MKKSVISGLVEMSKVSFFILFLLSSFIGLSVIQQTKASELDPNSIIIARPTWDNDWFHTEVMRALLSELGYTVREAKTTPNPDFYKAVVDGSIDLWLSGNMPNHTKFVTPEVLEKAKLAGNVSPKGHLQGYLIDAKTVNKYKIKTISDFKRPEVLKAFDYNNNGKADLIGCNSSWGCRFIIDHHIKTYGLEKNVEQIVGDFARMTLIAFKRLKEGKPVLIYARTPHGLMREFMPGIKTFWLPVPFDSLPGAQSIDTRISIKGCLANPCRMGLPANDIHIVANKEFLEHHPDIEKLVQHFHMDSDEISDQNNLMYHGEDDIKDIRRHARNWIAKHRAEIDVWLTESKALQVHDVANPNRKNIVPYRNLKVVAKKFEPFVIVEADHYSGFSIELWDYIARKINITYTIQIVHSMAKLLDEVQRKSADIAISGIGMTKHREEMLDFSHTYFESGLQIMIRENPFTLITTIFSVLFSKKFILLQIMMFFSILLAAHFIWLIERRKNPHQFPQSYLKGVFESFWWASSIVAGREGWGKPISQSSAKLFTFTWMFAGYFIFVYFTASVTTAFTIQEMNDDVQGVEDILNQRVATVKYSIAEDYLIRKGFRPVTVNEIEEAYKLLENHEVDAVVYHAPMLNYYSSQQGKDKVKVVGEIFYKQQYGFALQTDTHLREKINKALLELIEEGIYRRLQYKWFGRSN